MLVSLNKIIFCPTCRSDVIDLIYIYIGIPGIQRYYGDLKQLKRRKNLHYNSKQQIIYYLDTDIYKNDTHGNVHDVVMAANNI